MGNNKIEPKKIVGKANKRPNIKTNSKMEAAAETTPLIKPPGTTGALSERPGEYQVYPGE